MQLGGPVWHVSVAPVDTALFSVAEARCWAYALDALDGVGDPALGEWRERGEIAVHVRRRLTNRERRDAGNLDVVDIRGTDEHTRRVLALRPFLPRAMQGAAITELV